MPDVALTLDRERPFDPPDTFMDLQERATMHRMTYPDGHLGWLVTGHAAARNVLSDPRFSNRVELQHAPVPSLTEVFKQAREKKFLPPGHFLRMDAPEHTRYRKLLAGQFTVRRMNQLWPRIEEITEACLNEMETRGKPADLVQAFALPIPSLVICELLGVPYDDRAQFQADTNAALSIGEKADEMVSADKRLIAYLYDLIQRKRAESGDDGLLSGLIASGQLTDEELTGVAFLLLVAGHETTANMLAHGTYALLSNPEQLAMLRADFSLMENAVEELMRYLTVFQLGPVRTALEDAEIDGHLVKKGETVTIHLAVANRDPARFPAGEHLDVTRSAAGHLGFGHGIHQCLGQQLARIEMRIGYAALLRRFPDLRLAVAPADVAMRTDMLIYGVHRLPVTW
ncbi:cytochrome P450 [Nonomuraea sp. NPDC049695]|uniref:cytochrome P450 n=1 Tax=Nonomuraea sp. NPDC049695 TaxID=3154734 RepID=UPI0034265CD5